MSMTPEQLKALIEQKKREIEMRKQMGTSGVATPMAPVHGARTPAPPIPPPQHLRLAAASGIRTPMMGGLRTPLAQGMRTPAPAGIRTPNPSAMMQSGMRTPMMGIRTPLPQGVRTPAPTGIRTPAPLGATTPLPFGARTPLPSGMSDMHMRVQAQLEGLRQRASSETEKKARGLIMDDKGRMVDADGNVIVMERRVPELSVNMKAKRQEEMTRLTAAATGAEQDDESNPFFDERLGKRKERSRKGFSFVEPGHFQEQAKRDRAREKLERLQADIASASELTGLSTVTKIALITPKKEELEVSEVPDVEWWDSVLVKNGYELSYDPETMNMKEITNLVQHPITIDPPGSERQVTMPVYLTKAEKKKMRRQRRKAVIEEKTEKIRLGLMEAPAPKVKISNLMRVLGTEAVADPTKIEAIAKAQMNLRQQQHKEHNEAQALTKKEKAEKKAKKLQEDTTTGVHVAVFRVGNLRDESIKFKVNMNAQQYNLSGSALMTSETNVVVVEGGARGVRRYKALMLRRIKWNKADDDDVASEDEEDGDEEHSGSRRARQAKFKAKNYCDLVWEGIVGDRNFKDFSMKLYRSEAQAREFFDKRGVAHYWDLALASTTLKEE